MSHQPFQFKKFSIQQDKTAMKVGTDGVLLGAWAKLSDKVYSILDIGSGTGLIALMMAQKSQAEIIDAVELDSEAYVQSMENFELSEWNDRLFCYHASIQQFADEIEEQYDFIISNPPFYTTTFKELADDRAMARHTLHLTYHELLSSVVTLLAKNGSCAFIIPYSEEANFIEISRTMELYPFRITNVKGMKNTPVKRSLLQFSSIKKPVEINQLTIEIKRHQYTEDYIKLVKDFYLRM